ncbi:hypothetical protein DFH94DRAFT_752599 [Russula ochroleuca]|uniref:Uncharacterized protein n=1 Tax=Russula ochroleuca TaxID=152965 RepID=A0A9P5MSR8_9AGAM|nr:hypothetical protein DFH94DRAFT_752599 [Russula ochroleuca]
MASKQGRRTRCHPRRFVRLLSPNVVYTVYCTHTRSVVALLLPGLWVFRDPKTVICFDCCCTIIARDPCNSSKSGSFRRHSCLSSSPGANVSDPFIKVTQLVTVLFLCPSSDPETLQIIPLLTVVASHRFPSVVLVATDAERIFFRSLSAKDFTHLRDYSYEFFLAVLSRFGKETLPRLCLQGWRG